MILEVVYCLTYRHTFVNRHENSCPQIHHHIDTENSIKTDTLTHSILEKKWVPITKEWNKSLGTECPWELLHSCKHVFSFLLYFPHLFSSTVISVCFRLCYIFPISLALSMSSQLQRNVRIRSTFFFLGNWILIHKWEFCITKHYQLNQGIQCSTHLSGLELCGDPK